MLCGNIRQVMYPVINSYFMLFACDFNHSYSQWGASTALMMAAQQGNYKMINILLRHGADGNAKNQVISFERCAGNRVWWVRIMK